LRQGELAAVVALGPAAPREFIETVATAQVLAPLVTKARGGMPRMQDGIPNLRLVRAGNTAQGRGWIGVVPRGASVTTGISVTSLLPVWVFLLLIAGLSIAAWLREGRR
jgi:hypothetical protein